MTTTSLLAASITILAILLITTYLITKHKKAKQVPVEPNSQKPPNEEEETQIMVHDLRAPVVAIKNSASLMLSNKLNEDDQKNMMNLIHDQANNLLTQISTILEAAKIDGGRLVLKKTPGNLGIVVNEELSLFRSEAKRKNIELVAQIGNDLPVFSFDNVRITEALNNIISNSLKYTNQNGHVNITVDTDDLYKKTKNQGSVVVTVKDDGIGIPMEKQHMLFKKFSDLNNGTDKSNERVSSGLGLYITKEIVDAHGGIVKIDSEVGKGTTTTIILPITTIQQPQPIQTAQPNQSITN